MAEFVRYVFWRVNKPHPYGLPCACCGQTPSEVDVFTYVIGPRTTFVVCRHTCSYVATTFDDLCASIGKLMVGRANDG